jgi:acyl-CoA synthetase (AMP-forming)/AMP-acid ligase II
LQGLLVGDVLASAQGRVARRPAVTHRGRTLTYAETAARAEHLVAVLAGRGVGAGDRVVWWGGNTVDAVPLYFALAQLGAVFVPLNPSLSTGEVAPILDRADPALVVVDGFHAGDVELDALLAARPPSVVDQSRVDESTPHIIFFTSGTTGTPKGVVLSHRTDVIRASLKGASLFPRGATVCMFPQFHMAGWLDPLAAWISGEEVVYVDGGDPDTLLDAVQRHRAARLYCIPAVWRRVMEAGPQRFDTSSLRQADTGTSAITVDLLGQIRRAFPQTTTTVTYGSTEAGVVTQLWPEDVLRKPGSVGPPVPGVFVRIDEGELLVQNPWLTSGYFRDAQATAAALDGGWYRTGELAEIDADGHCLIVGRVKDVIRSGGETVSPVEVDLVIGDHPAVLDAAVAGVPDEEWGEIVTAFVVVRAGSDVDLAALRAHCEGRLARFKHPRRLVHVDAIPRTETTGQVQRRLLVELAQDQPGERAAGRRSPGTHG